MNVNWNLAENGTKRKWILNFVDNSMAFLGLFSFLGWRGKWRKTNHMAILIYDSISWWSMVGWKMVHWRVYLGLSIYHNSSNDRPAINISYFLSTFLKFGWKFSTNPLLLYTWIIYLEDYIYSHDAKLWFTFLIQFLIYIHVAFVLRWPKKKLKKESSRKNRIEKRKKWKEFFLKKTLSHKHNDIMHVRFGIHIVVFDFLQARTTSLRVPFSQRKPVSVFFLFCFFYSSYPAPEL